MLVKYNESLLSPVAWCIMVLDKELSIESVFEARV